METFWVPSFNMSKMELIIIFPCHIDAYFKKYQLFGKLLKLKSGSHLSFCLILCIQSANIKTQNNIAYQIHQHTIFKLSFSVYSVIAKASWQIIVSVLCHPKLTLQNSIGKMNWVLHYESDMIMLCLTSTYCRAFSSH